MILETERLTLSEYTADDAAVILELLNSPGWLRYIGDRNVHTPEEARNYLQYGPMSSYARSGFGFYNVKLKSNGASIGMCGLVKREQLEDIDIGFAFLPQYEKQGYAYEAAKATLRHAKIKLELNRVVAITREDNTSCIALLEKLGLQYERRIRFANEELLLYAAAI